MQPVLVQPPDRAEEQKKFGKLNLLVQKSSCLFFSSTERQRPTERMAERNREPLLVLLFTPWYHSKQKNSRAHSSSSLAELLHLQEPLRVMAIPQNRSISDAHTQPTAVWFTCALTENKKNLFCFFVFLDRNEKEEKPAVYAAVCCMHVLRTTRHENSHVGRVRMKVLAGAPGRSRQPCKKKTRAQIDKPHRQSVCPTRLTRACSAVPLRTTKNALKTTKIDDYYYGQVQRRKHCPPSL